MKLMSNKTEKTHADLGASMTGAGVIFHRSRYLGHKLLPRCAMSTEVDSLTELRIEMGTTG